MPTSDHNSFSFAFNLDIADGSDIEYLRAEKTIFFWSFSKLVMMSLVEGPMIFVPASPLGLHGLLRVPPIVAASYAILAPIQRPNRPHSNQHHHIRKQTKSSKVKSLLHIARLIRS